MVCQGWSLCHHILSIPWYLMIPVVEMTLLNGEVDLDWLSHYSFIHWVLMIYINCRNYLIWNGMWGWLWAENWESCEMKWLLNISRYYPWIHVYWEKPQKSSVRKTGAPSKIWSGYLLNTVNLLSNTDNASMMLRVSLLSHAKNSCNS
jgi:hypothetical protein